MTRAAGEKKVRLAAHLYEAREVARRLLGDGYQARVREYSEVIAGVAAGKKISVMAAVTELARASTESGRDFGALLVLATCVEMVEPSPGIELAPVDWESSIEPAGPSTAAPKEGLSPITVEHAMQFAIQDGPLDGDRARAALRTLRDEVMFRWEQRTALSFRLQELRSIAADAKLAADSKLYLAIHDATATAEAWMHPRTLKDAAQDHINGLKRRVRELEQKLEEVGHSD